MSRLTPRLPETLHRFLSNHAEREGTSLNQYIVFSLPRVVTTADLAEQKEAFDELISQDPQDEAEKALDSVLLARDLSRLSREGLPPHKKISRPGPAGLLGVRSGEGEPEGSEGLWIALEKTGPDCSGPS